jgi:hypothetical protein
MAIALKRNVRYRSSVQTTACTTDNAKHLTKATAEQMAFTVGILVNKAFRKVPLNLVVRKVGQQLGKNLGTVVSCDTCGGCKHIKKLAVKNVLRGINTPYGRRRS